MIDSYIKIPDNIGTSFEIVSGNIILGNPLTTYVGLSVSDIGHYIPYFIKNLLVGGSTEWEVGIGKVISTTIVERVKVSSSSNNNNLVIFSFGGTKTFFVYPNTYSSNLAYNNLLNASGVFSVPDVRSTHLVDLSASAASATLPLASGNPGLILDFKTKNRNSNNNLSIIPSGVETINGENSITIDTDGGYLAVISDGYNWIELYDNFQNTTSMPSSGTPQGNNGSIQYKVNSAEFGGSNIYFDAQNNSLLFGSSSGSSADILITPSGNTVFNRKANNIDFIINGSGNKSFMFSGTGKLGLNLPSGVQPQTIIHAIGNGCDTNLKLENRSTCSIPKITLYHKPSTLIDDNTEIASIHLAAKNSAGSETDYAQIKVSAVSPSSSNTKGSFAIAINNNNVMLNSLVANPTGILLQTNNRQLLLSQSGVISDSFTANSGIRIPFLTNSGSLLAIDQNSNIIDSGYGLDDLAIISSKASLSGASFTGNISAPKVLSPLSTNNFIDFNTLNLQGQWKLNSSPILSADLSSSSNQGKVLTHTGSGIVWTTFNEDNFLWSGQDISWKKYPIRDCVIQNNNDVLALAVTSVSNEFSTGDTIKIDISGLNYYRIISQISESNGYTNIVVDSPLPSIGAAKVISVSKGGYLDLSVDSSGAPNISPQSIISSRPGLDTSFNIKQNNIGFAVYGVSQNPALYINAQPSNRSDTTVPVVVNGVQPNTISQNNSLNKYASLSVSGYLYTDYIKIGETPAPSGYILVSTSGNIAQWKSTTTISELDGGVIVFSGVNL